MNANCANKNIPQNHSTKGICFVITKNDKNIRVTNAKNHFITKVTYHIILKHHTTNQMPTFQCQNCDKLYKTIKLLKIHCDDVHKQIKKYVCKICGISFGQPIQLFRHKKK